MLKEAFAKGLATVSMDNYMSSFARADIILAISMLQHHDFLRPAVAFQLNFFLAWTTWCLLLVSTANAFSVCTRASRRLPVRGKPIGFYTRRPS